MGLVDPGEKTYSDKGYLSSRTLSDLHSYTKHHRHRISTMIVILATFNLPGESSSLQVAHRAFVPFLVSLMYRFHYYLYKETRNCFASSTGGLEGCRAKFNTSAYCRWHWLVFHRSE